MPIYEYRCSACGALSEKICRSDVQEIACPQCGEPARRIVSLFAAKSGETSASAPACRPTSGFT